MPTADLREAVFSINRDAQVHGVSATVTRPHPDDTPITTTVIWALPMADAQAYGVDYRKKDPRRVLAIPRSDVPTLPRGTTVLVAEPGGTVRLFVVDGFEQATEPEHWRAIVKVSQE
jgi:hypothetical protein